MDLSQELVNIVQSAIKQLGNSNVHKIYFPVFSVMGKAGIKLPFGLLKYSHKEGEAVLVEVYCCAWNFLEFTDIYEQVIKSGITPSLSSKLELYFQ